MTETRAPSPLFYIAMVAAIAIITGVALTAGVVIAVRILAILMFVVACLRAILPTGTIPHIRGKVADVLTLVILASGAWYLASFGDLTPV